MQIEVIFPRRAIDNAFLQESITETEFETLRRRLLKLLNQADDAIEEGEFEEQLKGVIKPFFRNTNFEEDPETNTSELEKEIDQLVYELYGLVRKRLGLWRE